MPSTADLAFFPIQHEVLHRHYDTLVRTFWSPHDIDYKDDRDHWNKLDEDTKFYIKNLIFMFAQLDGLINENLIGFFQRETSTLSKDAGHFYAMQCANETIHNETYSVLIETFITDITEKSKGFDSIKHYPDIAKIGDWVVKWMDGSIPLLERVIAFACIEGIIFSSAFAGIQYLKRRVNKLRGLILANEWISRDEALHTQFAVDLFHIIAAEHASTYPRPSQERVHEIVKSAVEVCEQFTRNSMNVHLVGLNADDMMGYVNTTADWVTDAFGYEKIYKCQNPLEWMTMIALQGKTNMFEGKVSNYARNVSTFLDKEDDEDVDF
jgi:ribonucleoside-diphosphate reductase subunit M2